jgi:MFS family permease
LELALRLARALSHRNYRLFFYGQSVSLVGTWITRVAISWLVYRLTGSELLLGIVGFAGQIPTLLLAPFAGVVVDRHNRHRILIWTQAASLVQSVLLAILTLSDLITVPQLIVLQLLQGVVNSFDTPARQALVVEMVTNRADVPNAIALNSSMVNGSRVIGPAIGGVIIAAVGEGWCFAIDAVSYVGVIVSLLLMRLEPRSLSAASLPLLHDLRSGFQYVRESVPIRSGLILLALVSVAGVPYTVLMPAVVAETLGGGPDLLGWLMGASGVGALSGALYLASRETVVGLGRVILTGALAFGAGLVAFSATRSVWLAAPVLAFAGAGFIVQAASTNTVIQTIVDEQFRGRVMAFYTMAFFGSVPIGSLISGVVATYIGATTTIRVGGFVCIAAGLWFATRLPVLRAAVRPIYIKRGIIAPPDVDPGGTAG